jgi:triosephosphate isomerase (TIM)
MFYCAGNWKMNKTAKEAAEFTKNLVSESKPDEQENMVLLVPALIANSVAEGLSASKVRWGCQNAYFETKGAFTGENSPEVMAGMGARFCLVGHSERRQVFGEQDELIAKKVAGVQNAGMIPILCVGETLDDRKWRRTNEVIGRQLRQGLSLSNNQKPVWVAYEPVWAIGTGQVATPEQVGEAHTYLKEVVESILGTQTSVTTPILYGGSVKPDNAGVLRALNHVSGFLIGGASLDPNEFLKIYRA